MIFTFLTCKNDTPKTSKVHAQPRIWYIYFAAKHLAQLQFTVALAATLDFTFYTKKHSTQKDTPRAISRLILLLANRGESRPPPVGSGEKLRILSSCPISAGLPGGGALAWSYCNTGPALEEGGGGGGG